MYCGPECRDEAQKTYHPYECGITEIIHQAQIGGWALAYRALTTNRLQYFLDQKDTFLSHDEQFGSENNVDEVLHPILISKRVFHMN